MYTDDFPVYVRWHSTSHINNRSHDSQLPILVDTEAPYQWYSINDGKINQSHLFYSNVPTNNVLLVKIEGPIWYTIYHQLPALQGVNKPPLFINQPKGKGNQWYQQLFHGGIATDVLRTDSPPFSTRAGPAMLLGGVSDCHILGIRPHRNS